MKKTNKLGKTFKRLRELLIFAGVEEDEYRRISSTISEYDRRTVQMFSVIGVLFMGGMTVISFFLPSLESNRAIYEAGLFGLIASLALSMPVFRTKPAAQVISMYLFAATLLMFGIVLGTINSVNEITATFIALMLVIPQVLVDKPWRMCLLIAMADAVFMVIAANVKPEKVWTTDIINGMVFGLLSMVSCVFVMTARIRRYCLEDRMREMAETDALTGVKNRNCFENRFSRLSVKPDIAIFCVYVDANGLHELNNTYGHEAGDNMLRFVGAVMLGEFGAEHTYRVGGDEFVAFMTGGAEEEVREKMTKLKKLTGSAGYHVAVGIAAFIPSASGVAGTEVIQASDLVRIAETDMYRDKDEYYSSNNIAHVRER